jgi:hypothetical protein
VRTAVLALLATLFAAAPAAAAVSLGAGPVHAITASGGQAWVVVESGPPADPWALMRSTGSGSSEVRLFGTSDAIFPDVAAGPGGRVFFSYGRSISGGERYFVGAGVDEAEEMGEGTGPGRLFVGSGGPQLAYPDIDGDATLDGRKLTFDAPHRRHFPQDTEDGLVLDMAQTRRFTELHVHGRGAPRATIDVSGGRRALTGSMAVAGDRIYVAYTERGRAYVAEAERERDARWDVQALPGPGGSTGGAAVVRSQGRTVVAYSQRGEMYLWNGTARRLTSSPDRDGEPVAAADPESGAVYVAWTRRDESAGTDTALLERAAAGGSVKRR